VDDIDSCAAYSAAALAAGQTERAAEILGSHADDPDASAPIIRLRVDIEEKIYGPAAARPWMERVALATEPTWTCNVCGHAHDTWVAHCGHCATFDSLHWGTYDGASGIESAVLSGVLPPVGDAMAQAESPGMTVLPTAASRENDPDADLPLRAAS
jgi:HemY protein